MNFRKITALLGVALILQCAFAQNNTSTVKSNISGKIIEQASSEALPYVSVSVLKNTKDSTLVDGGITDDNGVFNIKNVRVGKYILKFSFVGYKDEFKNIELTSKPLNIGTVSLSPSAENLNTVTIVGAKQLMEYKLDKRVINVDQNLVSTGGNASDVLEDVPSIEIDEEGNVSLRGSSNVTLLVDGKPSSLYGNDIPSVLAQIPASQIDKVEVITNPSAKYSPEGMSGIINITLKEKGNRGFNGNINLSSGSALEKWKPNESAALNLNYSTKKYTISLNGDIRYNERERRMKSVRKFRADSTGVPDFVYTRRNGGEDGLSYGFGLNAEYYINQLNTIGLNLNMHAHKTSNDWASTINQDLTKPESSKNNIGTTDGDNKGSFNNIGITYEKKFKNKKDELLYGAFTWSWGGFDHYLDESTDYVNPSLRDYNMKDTSTSNHNHAVADVHYVYPFSEDSRLEVGYNLNYNWEKSHNLYYYDQVFDPTSSYDFERTEQVHALYLTYGFQIFKKFSAQLGLRGEIVKNDFTRTMKTGLVDNFDKDYNSLYPTIHLSYQLNKNHSFQVSYSRRIRRPDPWTMMPHVDLSNPEYVRFGNPNIDPEYTNAFELGWSWMFEKTTIFTSAYYRQVSNGMQRFEFLWNEDNAMMYGFDWAWDIAGEESSTNRTAQTFVNLAHSSNYGIEIIIDREITKWWNMNISGNGFGSYQDGTELNYDKINSFNFNAKLSSTITLPHSFSVQVSGHYYAPRKTIQGKSYAHYDFDLAVKKSLWDKRANLSLNIRDIFRTRNHDGYSYTDEYVSFNSRRPYSQSIRLSFSYNFGKTANMKKKLKQQRVEDSYSSGESYD